MIAWVAAVVWVMWQAICGVVIASVRNENGVGRVVAGLHLQPGPVDGAAVEPRRRAGLQPAHAQAQAVEPVCDRPMAGASPTRPAGIFSSPIWIRPLQEGAGGQHHARRRR